MSEDKKKYAGQEPVWSTYFHAKGAALGLPVAGNFELTSRCNFNCKMCYVHSNSAEGELSAEEWIALGKAAADSGMVFLLITGGEPLLRPDFKEIYTGLKKLGLLISINTNGSLIDEEMVEFFKKDPPLRINISLYGGCNATYESLCKNAAFDKVTNAIRALKEAGIQVKINSSVTPYNACDIEEIYRFGESVQIPVKATTYMFPPVRVNGCKYGDAPHRFTPEEAAANMLKCREQYMTPEQLASFSGADPMDDELDCTDGQGEHMRCRAGKTAFWITWDGRMLPCGMFPIEGWSVKEKGFSEAWRTVREYCASLILPARCKSCSLKERCPSCAAACLAESGDTSVLPEYICKMTYLLEEMTSKKYKKGDGENEN